MDIKPKTRNQKVALMLIALTIASMATYVFNSKGFCYQRHNGLYCYQGTNLNLIGVGLLIFSSAILVHFAELYRKRTIEILHNSASLSVFCVGIIFIGVAIFMAGPNA
jgi:hypothetical protein